MAFTFEKASLREVGSWFLNDKVTIPDIQRDLLWTPKQVALLWDSIFKGMPIGTFMMQEQDNALIDGQQRLNAIATGFNSYKVESPDSMIWLDFNGSEKISDNDIMVTTIAQPWGYCKNEDRSKLTASERRDSLSLFKQSFHQEGKENESFYNLEKKFNLYHSWPTKATGLLIPFSCLLQKGNDVNEYVNKAVECYRTTFGDVFEYFKERNNDFSNQLEQALKGLFELVRTIESYEIGLTKVNLESVKDVELLFSRLSTAGTQISGDDLAYAVIKAYFNGIKEHDSEVRLNHVEPSKLARIVLRIAASDSRGFVGNLSPNQIRQKGEDKPENDGFKSVVAEYYKNLDDSLKRIKAVFDSCNVPTVLRVSIAGKTPDLYMLLLYICHRTECMDDDLKRILCGMTLYLKWFCSDIGKAINIIYRYIVKDVSVTNIKRGLMDVQSKYDYAECYMVTPLVEPNKYKKLVSIQASDTWQPNLTVWNFLWDRTVYNGEMLLYYQRNYLSKHFKNYNPSNHKMWEGHNCPWDVDHIIPKNWFCNYSYIQKLARFNKQWKDSIGNLAAISFEANRSKSDNPEWSYYDDNKELNVKVDRVKKITKEFNSDAGMATEFAQICFDRCCAIYEDCYSNLFCELVDEPEKSLTELEEQRKSWMELIAKKINGKVRFVVPGSSVEMALEDYPQVMWAMPWLSFGTIVGDYYVAVAIGIEDDKLEYEIGVRKAPSALFADVDKSLEAIEGYKEYNDGWWYIEKGLSEDQMKSLDLETEFDALIKHVSKPK